MANQNAELIILVEQDCKVDTVAEPMQQRQRDPALDAAIIDGPEGIRWAHPIHHDHNGQLTPLARGAVRLATAHAAEERRLYSTHRARAVDPRVEAMSMTADGADQRLYTLPQSWVIGHTHQEIDRVHYSPGIYSDDESGRESKSC